ncbi:MAG: hypothetical protein K6F51_02595 [Acetatifactor sp.]|nr:hypothetical protein [Acetatifactor sp.]
MILFDYNKVFETANAFAHGISKEIVVQDGTHQSILWNGKEYPCVPLKFYAKGNSSVYERLLKSGCCTKMNGCVENGKRVRRVLLWVESDCENVHLI